MLVQQERVSQGHRRVLEGPEEPSRSEKAPGARLKVGLSYLNEKNTAKAKEHLNRVVKEYPTSKEADIAKERLKKLGK